MTEEQELIAKMGAKLCACGENAVRHELCLLCYVKNLEKSINHLQLEVESLRFKIATAEQSKIDLEQRSDTAWGSSSSTNIIRIQNHSNRIK